MERADFRIEVVSRRELRGLAVVALAAVVVGASASAWLLTGRPHAGPPIARPVQVLAYDFHSSREGAVVLRSGLGPLAPAGIFLTEDGGRTWQPLAVPVPTPAAGRLRLFPDGAGLLLLVRDESGGRASLYATADRGATWEQRTLPRAAGGEEVMTFLTAVDGFEVFRPAGQPAPLVFRTRDGGRTWSAPAMAGLPAAPVSDPVFVDPERGFALQSGLTGTRIFRTGDGGEDWSPLPLPVDLAGASTPPSVFAFGDTVLLLLGSTLAVSRDLGATFSEFHPLPPGAGTEGRLACLDAQSCRLAFDLAYLSTDDGARTWTQRVIHLPDRLLLTDLQPVSAETSWGVASGGDGQRLIETSDGGVSWREVRLPPL